METFRKSFFLTPTLILFQSCIVVEHTVNHFHEKSSVKNSIKELDKNFNETKRFYGSGEFVDLKNGKSEIFFMDNIKPKGHLVIIDSLAQDSLVKMIIVNDTIIKNNH